jgi:hypothetical protein
VKFTVKKEAPEQGSLILWFPLLTIIPPLLYTTLSHTPPELCDSPEQAAQYHILSICCGFISAPVLGWLYCQQV